MMIIFDAICWMMGLVIVVCAVVHISAGLIFFTAETLSYAIARAVEQPKNVKAWKEFRKYKRGKLIDNKARESAEGIEK